MVGGASIEELERNHLREVQQLNVTIAQLRADLLTAQETIRTSSGCADKSMQLEAKIAQLQHDLDSADSRHQEHIKELTAKFSAALRAELEKQKAKFVEISNRQKAVFLKQKDALEQSAKQIDSLTDSKKQLQESLEKAQSKYDQLVKQLQAQQAALMSAEKDKNSAASSLETSRNELLTQISTQKAMYESLQKDFEDTKRELEESKRKSDAASKMYVSLDCKSSPPQCGDVVSARVSGIDKPSFKWYRSYCGSSFAEIHGVKSADFVLSSDDIGAAIKVEVYDGDGSKSSAELGPVSMTKLQSVKLQDFLKSKNSNEFAVEPLAGASSSAKTERFLLFNKEKIKFREGKKTLEKKDWNRDMYLALDPLNTSNFSLILEPGGAPQSFSAKSAANRDLISLCFRAMFVSVLVCFGILVQCSSSSILRRIQKNLICINSIHWLHLQTRFLRIFGFPPSK